MTPAAALATAAPNALPAATHARPSPAAAPAAASRVAARPRRDDRGGAVAPAVGPPRTSSRSVALWPAVVELVRAGNALLGAVIADARPVAVDGEDLTVGVRLDARRS